VYSICRRGSSSFDMDTRRLMDTKQNTMKCQLAFIVVLILATSLSANAAGHTMGRAVQQLTSEFKNGKYVWHPEISPAGRVVIIVSPPGQSNVCLPRSCPHRRLDRQHRNKKPYDSDWYISYFAEKGYSRIQHLQRGTDAPHATTNVDRHHHSRLSFARLSSITWVCTVAGRFRCKTLFGHHQRYERGHYRQQVCPG
jgi:hypothetical protein